MSTGPCNSCTFSAHGTLLSLGGNRANTDGAAAGGRHQHRRAAGRRHQLPDRHAQRAGSDLHGLGQHGRGGVGRAGDEHHPALGRQHDVGQRLRVVGQRRPAGQQPERRAARRSNITPSPLIKSYDLSGAVGGPIQQGPRLVLRHRPRPGQLAATSRTCTTTRTPATRTSGSTSRTSARQAFNDKTWQNASGRITAQVTPRNKVNVFWDEQSVCASARTAATTPTRPPRPRPTATATCTPMRFQQATWTSPVNNKLLLEGGFGYFFSRWGGRAKEDPNTESLVAHHRAVRGGLPGQRQHPEPDVPLADDGPVQRRPQQEHHHHVARDRGAT